VWGGLPLPEELSEVLAEAVALLDAMGETERVWLELAVTDGETEAA
jgi:hypothetical protein